MGGAYDPLLVGISVTVAVVASYVALDMASRVEASRGRTAAAYWLTGGSISMGTGIWSQHIDNVSLSYTVGGCSLAFMAATLLISAFDAFLAERATRHAEALHQLNVRLEHQEQALRRAHDDDARARASDRGPFRASDGPRWWQPNSRSEPWLT